jgi:hypothetical protein
MSFLPSASKSLSAALSCLALTSGAAIAQGTNATDAAGAAGVGFLLIFLFVFGLALYFLPTIIGFARKQPNAVAILALNLFLGWSLVGWVVSLVWALSNQATQNITIVNHPGTLIPQPPATAVDSSVPAAEQQHPSA